MLKNNKTKAKLIPFIDKTFSEGAFIQNNNMEVIINQDELKMETESIALEGKHNMKNAMAATLWQN
jgi:UDP-N-acetylmuramoylalanine--D-glutamate ligase